MNELLDDDDRALSRSDRELTLSTGAILGIFLALALLCGACFGVGYNMGRKSLPAPLALNDGSGETLADANSSPKPAAGSAADSGATVAAPAVIATVPAAPAPKPAPIVRKPPPVDPEATPAVAPAEPPAENTESAPSPRAVSPSALLPGAGSSAAQTGSIMVQVAAVSHKEDADLLVGALRARGYTVSARPTAGDSFIHVQVGPFNNKKDAEAMRQRLLADGYNALLKF